MDAVEEIMSDLKKGFSKSDLEKLIGLPLNSLSGVLNNKKKLSTKSVLKIEKWAASDKPNPLDLPKVKNEMALAKLKMTTPRSSGSIRIDIDKIKLNETDQIAEPNNSEVKRQIELIKEEKIPSERNTILGKKSWEFDRQKRIIDLEKQL